MTPSNALLSLECSRCGRTFDPDAVAQLCACGGPLLARYDLGAAARTMTRDSLRARPKGLWRYRELLPLRDPDAVVSLGEPATPILRLKRLGESLGLRRLYLKDEGLLPTGSFKARGAAVGVSRARELGVKRFAMPTNGNAGVAWSLYGARAGMSATVVMPAAAPAHYREQCAAAGAQVVLVNGFIGDAGRMVSRLCARYAIFDASTLKEPYRIEGKKTLGFEIAEQFDWDPPDTIVYPTGGGVGLIGMHKAFGELREMGLLSKRCPRFIAVQASGCAPIVTAWEARADESEPWKDPHTLAFGINVPKAFGDFLILRALRESGGGAVSVQDEAAADARQMLARNEGVLACLEGAAAMAAVISLVRSGAIASDERVLVINTGSGFAPATVSEEYVVLEPGDELPFAPTQKKLQTGS